MAQKADSFEQIKQFISDNYIIKKKRKKEQSPDVSIGNDKEMESGSDSKKKKKKHKKKQVEEEVPLNETYENSSLEMKKKKKKKIKNKDMDSISSDQSSIVNSQINETKDKKLQEISLDDTSLLDLLNEVNVKSSSTPEKNKGKKRKLNDSTFEEIDNNLNGENSEKEEKRSSKKKRNKINNDDSDLGTNLSVKEVKEKIKRSESMILEELHFVEEDNNKEENKNNKEQNKNKNNSSPKKKITSNDNKSEDKQIKKEFQNKITNEEDDNDSNEVTCTEMKDIVSKEFIVSFDVPRLHTLHARVSVVPKDIRQYIKTNNIPVKTGHYTSEEDEKILNNWKYFCEVNNLDENNPAPFFTLKRKEMPRFKTEQFANFLQILGHSLNDRLLNSVYERFKKLIHDNKKRFTHFSEKEDEIILNYIRNGNSKHPIVDLAKILKRSRDAVKKRIFYLNNIKNKKFDSKICWTMELTNKITRLIMDKTKSTTINELKKCHINNDVWRSISEVTKIPEIKLKQRWNFYIYPGLFLPNDIDFRLVLEKVLNIVKKNKYPEWKQINWAEVATKLNEEYSGFTGRLLYKMISRLVNVSELENSAIKESLAVIKAALDGQEDKLFIGMVPKLLWDENETIYFQ